MSNHYSLIFPSKRLSTLYSHEYMMTTLPVQISKSVHSKKIILDTCTKTAFSFNNITYEQKDSVSMGSSLGPNMANIIMTELENKVIKPLINDGTIKFFCRFVNDTLLVVKPKVVSRIHKLMKSFDKNLNLPLIYFKMKFPIFLTWKCHWMEYRFTGRTPVQRIAWTRSLATLALKSCSSNKLSQELKLNKCLLLGMTFPNI